MSKLSAVIVAAVALSVACVQRGEPSPPFDRVLGPSNKIESRFIVREAGLYAVSLHYGFDEASQENRDKAWNFSGGTRSRPTLKAAINLNSAAGVVLRQTAGVPELSSWGAGRLSSELAAVQLRPGSYNLQVEVHGAAPPAGVVLSSGVALAYRGK